MSHLKLIKLPSTLKHFKGGNNLVWHTHKPNMHQPMHIRRRKQPYLWQQENLNVPWIQLLHIKRKPNIHLSLLHQPHSLFHIKPLLNLPTLILIKPTKYLSPIQLLYNYLNHIIPQILVTNPNTFNFRQNDHIGSYSCGGMHPIIHIPWIPYYMWWNKNPWEIHKADRRSN